jgi:Xaa-Pro aminopeptidase
VARISPGTTAGSLADAAVRAARDAGLTAYASPALGHGIGLGALERPRLAAGDDTAIQAGEVLCVEALHYEIGTAGFGLRDTVLVSTAGARVMNRSRHDLIVLD